MQLDVVLQKQNWDFKRSDKMKPSNHCMAIIHISEVEKEIPMS